METYKTWSSLKQAISHRFGNGHLAGAGFCNGYYIVRFCATSMVHRQRWESELKEFADTHCGIRFTSDKDELSLICGSNSILNK
jgi:hypothetical protein